MLLIYTHTNLVQFREKRKLKNKTTKDATMSIINYKRIAKTNLYENDPW